MSLLTPTENAYYRIEEQIRKFKSLSKRERDAYNEADTRKDFILPMFRAMEWNIDDMREVAAEEKISRGFVDFSFRINGVRRFVLETKRIGEDLNKSDFAQQAIDYAYHKGVTWAVLSDFERLKLFNAEAREQNPFQAQFKEFGVDDYLPRLDELWWLSRPAIIEGLLDREAEKVFKKSIKTSITQSLFDNLKDWRAKLYKLLREYNRGKLYDAKQIDDAVQRILDRLIFIRTAEDREVEGEKLIALVRELIDRNRPNELMPALNRRFRELDGRYNSQLFAPHYSENLDIGEPSTLAEIINGLYGSSANFTSYNFALIDADVLGRVYEQYLGYVLSEREELEAKKAKRKSQGIYYTPTFVVKYIVQQTLGKYLEENGYNAARTVRVLDPACGSGSFLIEAFDVLDQFLARESGQVHVSHDMHDYARHMQILTSNLYGVDKDEQAVEVAQLNLLLKALNVPSKLPKLENIRQGDSLINGTPKELEEYFGADWKKRNPFNWNEEFPSVMANGGFDVIVGNPPYVRAENMPRDERDFYIESEHFGVAYGRFDIHILFLERAIKLLKQDGRLGFIIPYAGLTQNYGMALREFILETCVIETIVDLSQYKVFHDASIATCILILRKKSADSIRQANQVQIIRQDTYDQGIQDDDERYFRIPQKVFRETPHHTFRLDLDSQALELIRKIDARSVKLGDICYLITGAVLHDSKTGESKERLIHDEPRRGYKPYIEAKEIARYLPPAHTRYLDYRPSEMHRPKFPELFENEKLMIARIASDVRATVDTQNLYTDHTIDLGVRKDRLVDAQSRDFKITKDDAEKARHYNLKYLLGFANSKLATFYLQRLLGMAIEINPETARLLPIRHINFDDAAEKQQHDKIAALVEEMMQLQKEYAQAAREKLPNVDALKRRIDNVDTAIDQAVYELYALTEDEIKLIVGSTVSVPTA